MKLKTRFNFLLEVVKTLELEGVKYWIDFGTLLGFVRQGDFLLTDPDIDIGVVREDRDKVMDVMLMLGRKYKIDTRVEDGCLMGYKIFSEDTWIDVAFYFKYEDKRIWKISQWDKVMVFDQKFFDVLQDLEVKGEKFKIPNHIEELMELKYGSDWRRPFLPGEEYDLHQRPNIENSQKYENIFR